MQTSEEDDEVHHKGYCVKTFNIKYSHNLGMRTFNHGNTTDADTHTTITCI